MQKRILSLFIVAAMLSGLWMVSGVAAETTATAYTPGVYTGTGIGQKGEVVIETEFSEDAIISITPVSHKETVRVSEPAFERVPAAIIANQSLAVDTVSSCTISSRAILTAVEDCVKQAGGDVAALKVKLPEARKSAHQLRTADVIIVGAGLAGLSAAMSALDAGANVIMFEKNDVSGGSSKLSGGFITAVQTDVQLEKGFNETFDEFMDIWEDSIAQSTREDHTDLAAVRAMIERSPSDIQFLNDHEVGLQAPTGFGGPREIWFFSDWRENFMDGAVAGGVDHTVRATAYLEKQDKFTIFYATPVTELLSEDGVVTGVVATAKDGSTIIARAKSVVLATGGWARSVELMERFCPTFPSDWVLPYTSASVGLTGDGIIMAESVGADVYDGWWMDLAVMYQPGTFESELNSLQRSVMHYYTDGTGKRLFNSTGLYGVRSIRMTEAYNETGAVWTVLDMNLPNAVAIVDKYVNNNSVYKADTLDELAGMIGVDKDIFLADIERYNEMVAAGTDTDMGQTNLVAIDQGPFYALNSKICTMGTLGGLKTDDNGQVLSVEGTPIEGLFAAGEVMNGKYFNQVYISGCAQLICVDSGRIAGASAAR